MSLSDRRTHDTGAARHLHNHFHFTQCLRQCVCVLSGDTVTCIFFFVFWSNVQHTHSQILVFTLEHVFSSWHMYMQSFSLACAGETEGEGSRGRREGEEGRKDRHVCDQTNAQIDLQTGSSTLWAFKNTPLPVFDPAPAPLVSHVHSSTRGALWLVGTAVR